MYDFILRNTTLVDGTRVLPRKADVCIKDGKIAALPTHCEERGQKELDVAGMIVAPGFIDIHTHSDTAPFNRISAPQSKLFQGVTLEITGNCGISALPLSGRFRAELIAFYHAALPSTVELVPLTDDTTQDYRRHVAEVGAAINYGVLIGHGTLRGSVMGFGMRRPTAVEQAQMEAVLDRELSYGAFGMSLGLIYPPSSYGDAEELIGLSRVLARHKAILSVHLRNEAPGVFDAIKEIITVAKASGVHAQISHLKLMGKAQWGRAGELLALIHAAQAEGVNITCDQYPYTASSTGLSALAPGWAHDGGAQELLARLKNPEQRLLADIAAEMDRRGGPKSVMISSTHGYMPEAEGKTIAELSNERGISPEQMVAQCLHQCDTSVSCIYSSMDSGDVFAIMKDMDVAVGSDGSSFAYDDIARASHLHPRNFGTFPRFFQTVFEQKLMSVEDAVYKVSGLPAHILGLSDRGIIAPGKTADLTVFDCHTIKDCCTYTDTVVKPQGIYHVFVNGVPALLDGVQTQERSGCVLCHQ
ncbi:MAG TPA: D-aminoacylase [Clostridia bacterium]|nr:D-aminoacylase [Clostridia bacterium]